MPALDADELASRINATPTLFINGQKLGSWDYATVQAAVEAAQP